MITIEPNNYPKATSKIRSRLPSLLASRLVGVANRSFSLFTFYFSSSHPKPLILPSLPTNHDRFMQNKPNFQNDIMNLTSYGQKDYEKKQVREPRKNKPNTNPSKIGVYPDSSGARRESNPISSAEMHPSEKDRFPPLSVFANRVIHFRRLPSWSTEQRNPSPKPSFAEFS